MMKIQLFLLSIIGVIFFSSCSNNTISERERALFMNPVFGYDITIDSLTTLEDLIARLDRIYCEDKLTDKWPVMYFDMNTKKIVNPKKGKDILAIGIEPSPCPEIMLEYDFTRILEVVKDGYNLEVEEQRIEPDSLTPFVARQYLNYGENPIYSSSPENNGIWLIAKKDDKLQDLNKYIAQIVEGYIDMAQQYSKITFGKSLDELSDDEYKELQSTLAFHLSFKFSDKAPQIINTLL